MNPITPIKAKRLSPGDTIGIAAPAGSGSREATEAGARFLEQQGFSVVFGDAVYQSFGYLAGTDTARAADVNAFFASPSIDGILCLRGGYGTMRILELLDYACIQANPKVFVGYSDITALHLAIHRQTGLITFHGPMAASDMGREMPNYSWDLFFRAIACPDPLGPIVNPLHTPPPDCISPGTAQGPLIGGNLSLICATLGTPYEIDTGGKLLFLEDVGEEPYRIDRMLTQLLLAGKLQQAAGILLGVFSGCDDAEPPTFSTEEVLRDRLSHLPIPILSRLYFGHTPDKATLPLGVTASMDAEKGIWEIMEKATI